MSNQINKTLHLFWGRKRPLSWLRLQTVVTFCKYNPDWTVKVWYRPCEDKTPPWSSHEQKLEYVGDDYFQELRKMPMVILCMAPYVGNCSDVHYSDYLRWLLLSTEGGFWSDFDIVYIRSMPKKFKCPIVVIRYDQLSIYPIGFLGSNGPFGKSWFSILEKKARGKINTVDGYQDIGCILLEQQIKRSRVIGESSKIVYPVYLMRDVKECYFTENFKMEIPKETIGIHWYAGAIFASDFENSIIPNNITQFQKSTNIIKAVFGELL